jgi:hypothetical protein
MFSHIHIRRAIRICGCTGDAHFRTIRILSEQVRDRGTIQISGSCGPEEQGIPGERRRRPGSKIGSCATQPLISPPHPLLNPHTDPTKPPKNRGERVGEELH